MTLFWRLMCFLNSLITYLSEFSIRYGLVAIATSVFRRLSCGEINLPLSDLSSVVSDNSASNCNDYVSSKISVSTALSTPPVPWVNGLCIFLFLFLSASTRSQVRRISSSSLPTFFVSSHPCCAMVVWGGECSN